MRPPELIAHRGSPRHHPENTLPGFKAALVSGARHLETDVQLTADQVPVLFHDATLERLCATPGGVDDYPLAALPVLLDGVAIPKLADMAALLRDWPRALLFAEIKPQALRRFGHETVFRRVARALEALRERTALISFDLDFLRRARAWGWPRLGVVLERWPQSEHALLSAIAPDYLFVDVDGLPAEGRLAWPGAKIAVYEVADPAQALRLAARGADLIETFAIADMQAALHGAAPQSCHTQAGGT